MTDPSKPIFHFDSEAETTKVIVDAAGDIYIKFVDTNTGKVEETYEDTDDYRHKLVKLVTNIQEEVIEKRYKRRRK
jgi:hypothetical protein